jgi:hypothetical protein
MLFTGEDRNTQRENCAIATRDSIWSKMELNLGLEDEIPKITYITTKIKFIFL